MKEEPSRSALSRCQQFEIFKKTSRKSSEDFHGTTCFQSLAVKIKAVRGENWGETLDPSSARFGDQRARTRDEWIVPRPWCGHMVPHLGWRGDLQWDLLRIPSAGHGAWNMGFAINSASCVLFFFVLFLLSYLFLFTFCLVRAWLYQPRPHLLQHCCEPVTNETAKSNALDSPVLLQVCQILQWLIRVCAVLEFFQLLLWIFKWV